MITYFALILLFFCSPLTSILLPPIHVVLGFPAQLLLIYAIQLAENIHFLFQELLLSLAQEFFYFTPPSIFWPPLL